MELHGKTLAITGAGGFIALRAAERAIERGMIVRGADVSAVAAARARRVGVDCHVGDVRDAGPMRRVFTGADVVLHTAAVVEEDGALERFRDINVGGTENVLEQARREGVSRFLHLSSVMVYGFDFPPDVTEDGPLRGENNPYCQTKIDSERAVMDAHSDALGCTAIRAGDVYGRGSRPWVVRPVELMQKGLFALPDGGRGVINHVHVDNLVDALLAALERDVVGESINVTDGVRTTCAEYFGYLARACGRDPIRSLPARPMRAAFSALERGARLFGVQPAASAAAVAFLLRPHAYSIEKARALLGYAPRVELASGMRDVAAWLRETGIVTER